MTQLTYSERARLARQGCTVVSERHGIAKCLLINGEAHWYCIHHLKDIARPSMIDRLRAWVLGGAS